MVQEKNPAVRTVYLFGDFPKVESTGDGTNLQDENGKNTPWLAGLYWPYRHTTLQNSFRVGSSGGFEGMAITTDKKKLLPLLEKPLAGSEDRYLLIHEFDLESKLYTGRKVKYELEPEGSAIGSFKMFSPERGVIIERDGSQGTMNGHKKIYEIEIVADNAPVRKKLAVDLLGIGDPKGLSGDGLPGDVGLGADFGFPFVTIESVVVLGSKKLLVMNDNNYPFSIGRHVGTGEPDDNEMIIIDLEKPLGIGSRRYVEKIKGKKSDDQNFPNPFSSSISIPFSCSKKQAVEVVVYSNEGAKVKMVFDGMLEKGKYEFKWDGKDEQGVEVEQGVYNCIVTIDREPTSRRIIKK